MKDDTPTIQNVVYDTASNMTTYGGSPWNTSVFPNEAVRAFEKIKSNKEEEAIMAETGRRLVQVFIVDPDPKCPVEKCLLYEGKRQLTELTDQELFYEINVKELLDKHNEYRMATVDRDATKLRPTGEPIHLEEIRVRDLVMSVVTLAGF